MLKFFLKGALMEIYIDESGSINNHNPSNKFFVISLIIPKNIKKIKKRL